MFEQITLNSRKIQPALFLAPMAGVTHSAFRRLIADFGGYGALFTEMLSGNSLLHEDLISSPFTKSRETEGNVIYQLLLSGDEDIPAIIEKIASLKPAGIDLNLGCPAPKIRKRSAGISLFHDTRRLENTLETLRRYWDGILSVKCRLGHESDRWKDTFIERLKIFECYKIDAITLHPRFSKDKLKRRARWELFSWIADLTDIPLIGNGDIISPAQITQNKHLFSALSGLMLGRIAVVKPWIFNLFSQHFTTLQTETFSEETINYAAVWETFYHYTCEDFPPEKAIGRIKEFSTYFARNFFFGHELYRIVQGARNLDILYDAAIIFLKADPKISREISVAGI